MALTVLVAGMSFLKNSTSVLADESLRSQLTNTAPVLLLDTYTDFTIAIRFKCTDFSSARGLMGSASTEFLRFQDNATLRIKIDNVNRDFALDGLTMSTDQYFTLLVVRNAGATGNINVFIRGNESLDDTATGTQIGEQIADPTEITISDLAVTNDEAGNFKGFFKDVLIWNGTAASSGDRKEIFDYIEGQ